MVPTQQNHIRPCGNPMIILRRVLPPPVGALPHGPWPWALVHWSRALGTGPMLPGLGPWSNGPGRRGPWALVQWSLALSPGPCPGSWARALGLACVAMQAILATGVAMQAILAPSVAMEAILTAS